MKPVYLIYLLTMMLVSADYLIKKATTATNNFYQLMIAAVVLYAISPIGWYVVLSKYKLVSVGAIYSILTIVMLALIGFICFKERLSFREVAGLVLAFVSIALLTQN